MSEYAYFKNTGGPQIVAQHGPVLPGGYLKTKNPIVCKGLRSHSRYEEITKDRYDQAKLEHAGAALREQRPLEKPNPEFRTGDK